MSHDPQTFKVAFAVTEAGPDVAAGDYFTALELGNALRKLLRWEVVWLPQPQWYEVGDANAVIAMTDHYDPTRLGARAAGLIKICWMRNWFDRWAGRPHFGLWDIRLCSSRKAADYIQQRHGLACPVLRIAANPSRFRPRPEEKLYDYVFTGSYWKAPRDIEQIDPAAIGLRFALYGKNWEQHPRFKAYWKGFAPYHAMPRIYNQSRMLVDDANSVTKTWASVNSRVFDALASGTLVVTNGAAGSAEVFDGLLPVYESPDALRDILRRYLDDEVLFRNTLEPLRERVLARHTYEIRARELARILFDHLKAGQARPTPAPDAAPPSRPAGRVAVVIPAVGAAGPAAPWLDALLANTPEDCEILVVGGGDDAGAAPPGRQADRVRFVAAGHGLDAVQARNRGAAAARASLLVFLDNDVEVRPGWLEPLLAWAARPDVGAAAGRLLFPDGSVAQAGLAVVERRESGTMLLGPAFVGESPAAAGPAAAMDMQAVSAACLLVVAADFRDVGGFDADCPNGRADADLCFKLARLGRRVVSEPGSLAVRHGAPPGRRRTLADRAADARLFARWQGLVAPDVIDDAVGIRPAGRLVRQPGETGAAGPEAGYGEALAGWWKRCRNQALAGPAAGKARVAVHVPSRRRFGQEPAVLGRELAGAFGRLGHEAALVEAAGPAAPAHDLAVHIRGPVRLPPRPGATNILWIVSHPELVCREELDGYDLVLCASPLFLRQIAPTTAAPCHHLPLAAAQASFQAAPSTAPSIDVLFLGDRDPGEPGGSRIVADALEAGCEGLRVVGRGWAGRLPEGTLLEEADPEDAFFRLAPLARIHLNGHGPALARDGFINRRAYDLAALGLCQIGNAVPGLEALGAVCCVDAEDLGRTARRLLADEAARQARAAWGRRRVAGETFDARARAMAELAAG